MSLPFELPVISLEGSILWSAVITLTYIGSVYALKATRVSYSTKKTTRRESAERGRNDPDVIKARMAAVVLSTAVCVGYVLALVYVACDGLNERFAWALSTTLELVGLTPYSMNWKAHLLTPVLFAGPVYVTWLDGRLPMMKNWSWKRDAVPVVFQWIGWRNYFFAPVTEEVTFRAALLSVHILAKASVRRMVFLSPMWFGAAHVHHAWENYQRYGRTPDAAYYAIKVACFQFLYTTVFGVFCCFVFLRTGSILPSITSHIYCNFFGLPAPFSAVREHRHRAFYIWATHAVGLVAFFVLLYPWTESSSAGTFYWNALE